MNVEMRGGGDVLHSEQQSVHGGSKVSFGIFICTLNFPCTAEIAAHSI